MENYRGRHPSLTLAFTYARGHGLRYMYAQTQHNIHIQKEPGKASWRRRLLIGVLKHEYDLCEWRIEPRLQNKRGITWKPDSNTARCGLDQDRGILLEPGQLEVLSQVCKAEFRILDPT